MRASSRSNGRWRAGIGSSASIVPPSPGARSPTPGEGAGQVGLLGHHVGGPVADAAGLDQQHLGVGGEQVGEEDVLGRQPRAATTPCRRRTGPRPAAPTTSRPHGSRWTSSAARARTSSRGQQLAAREDLHLGDVDRGPLVGHGELGQAVDLVAPQVDAHRHVGGGGEHVDDRAPHGHLAPVLDLVLAAVAGRDQPLDELGGVDLRRRGRRRSARPPQRAGPRRCSSARTGATMTRGPRPGSLRRHSVRRRRPMVSTPGLTRSNGSVSQAGEDVDLVGAEVGDEVVGQPVGVGAGGRDDEERMAAGGVGQPGDGQCPGRLGHRQGRRVTAEQAEQRRLVPEQGRERGERPGRVRAGGRHGARGYRPPRGCRAAPSASSPGAAPAGPSRRAS